MTEITIEVDSDSDVEAAVAAAIEHHATLILNRTLAEIHVPLAMQKIEEMAAGEMARNFLGSRSPDGVAMAPLARPRPKGHNPGIRPLIDTGELLQSVISNAPGHIERVSDDELTAGTNNWKAAIHQNGTRYIPARPFIGVSDTMADLAVEIVADELLAQLER